MALVRYIERGLISGSTLRQQRMSAGYSQRLLAHKLTEATGIEFNQMSIVRLEAAPETAVEVEIAQALQDIFSSPT